VRADGSLTERLLHPLDTATGWAVAPVSRSFLDRVDHHGGALAPPARDLATLPVAASLRGRDLHPTQWGSDLPERDP